MKRQETKLTSVRLCEACYQYANGFDTTVSMLVRLRANVLIDRYPAGLLTTERERLIRRARSYDRLTDGTRHYTKIRIPIQLLQFCKFNGINVTAACEFCILDAAHYLRSRPECYHGNCYHKN